MYVPFFSTSKRDLAQRAGGGGGGGSGGSRGGGGSGGGGGRSGGGGSSGGGKGSSGGTGGGGSGGGRSGGGGTSSGTGSGGGRGTPGSAGSTGTSVPLSGGSIPGRSGRSSASAYGSGDSRPITIPSGQAFAGRSAGGGTRNDIYGSRTYGSGYPGITGRGVSGRGFPFYFWPVVWGGSAGYGAGYLYDHEYGDPDDSTHPGGPMYDGTLHSVSGNTTVHILADNSTVASLISSIQANCTSMLLPAPGPPYDLVSVPQSYNASAPTAPKPEQAIQYYRASSIVLTLDGYNNTAALLANSSVPDAPIPAWANTTFLTCVNETIGAAAPLVDPQEDDVPETTGTYSSAVGARPDQHLSGLVSLAWMLFVLGRALF